MMANFHPARLPLRDALVPDLSDSTLVGSWNNIRTPNGEDYSSFGNDMTGVGTYLREDWGTTYDGNSDYDRVAIANFRSSDSAGTIEAWIKMDTLTGNVPILASSDEASTTRYVQFYVASAGNLSVYQRDNDTADTVRGGTTLVTGRWYHVVVTSTGSVYALYVDGAAETPSVVTGANNGDWFADTSARDNVTIGGLLRTSLAGAFDGQIASVNVFSEAKSADWVKTQYQKGVPDSSLVLWVPGGDLDYSPYENSLSGVANAIVGSKMTFGASQYVLHTEGDWRGSDSAGTVIAWIRPTTINALQHFFSSCDQASLTRYLAFGLATTNNPTVLSRSDGIAVVVNSDFVATANRWIQVAVVSDGSAYTIYTNGVAGTLAVAAGTNTGDWFADIDTRDNFVIGGQLVTSFISGFLGDIKDVRVYSEAKSAAWILDDYNKTSIFY
jgi:hypothetical protein